MQNHCSLQEPTLPLTLLYDADCPLCHFGAHHYAGESGLTERVNARFDSDLKARAIEAGFDIDEGVILEREGVMYQGSEAIRQLALTCERRSLYGKLFHLAFRSRFFSKHSYPLLKALRRIFLFLRGVPLIHEQEAKNRTTTIQRQLGDAWGELHPAIQKRFARDPSESEHIFYRGKMETIERSRAGKWFAFLTTYIGNPLTPYNGTDVPMDVVLHRQHGKSGIFWRRTYYYPSRKPYTVSSAKCETAAGEMQECVGGGFGMALKVYVEGGNLHFRSTRYFWRLANMRFTLPHLLTPGETHVVHEEVGEGWFRFTISMDHPRLGRTFYQTGLFKEQV